MDDALRLLADRLAIADLLALYCTALDTKDWPLLEQVFTPDAVCDYGATGGPHGLAEITETISRTLAATDSTQHLIGNVTAEVSGDTAVASAYLQAQHVRSGAEGGQTYLIGGRYDDELARTADGWRITRRTLTRMWSTGNRGVVIRP